MTWGEIVKYVIVDIFLPLIAGIGGFYLARSQARKTDAEAQKSAQEAIDAGTKARNDAYTLCIAEMQDEIKRLDSRVDSLSAQNTALLETINQLRREKTAIAEQVEAQARQIAQLTDEKNEQARQIAQLTDEKNEQARQISELQKENADLRSQLATVKKQTGELKK